jgi:hypothetical protein
LAYGLTSSWLLLDWPKPKTALRSSVCIRGQGASPVPPGPEPARHDRPSVRGRLPCETRTAPITWCRAALADDPTRLTANRRWRHTSSLHAMLMRTCHFMEVPINRPIRFGNHLYPFIKRYLEKLGLEVKGEVRGCDIVALSEGSPELVVIGEMKQSFTLERCFRLLIAHPPATRSGSPSLPPSGDAGGRTMPG